MNGYIPQITLMVICLIMSAYFSSTETAFSSLNKTKLKTLAEKGNKRAELACKLSEQYDRLLSTILIGNNVVNILLSSVATLFFINILQSPEKGSALSTVVITVLVLIFGEITPKSLAKDFPEKFAMFSAPIIRVFTFILTPLNFLFSQWKKLVKKLSRSEADTKMSQEELLMLVDETEQEGGIDSDEGDLLRNAINFTERKAEDILTHRVDLEGVSIDTPKEEVAKVFAASRFSRLLVYEETIDHIVGVIHQKDFYVGSGISDKELKDLISPPVQVYKNEKITDLLKLLQREKSHIAIVIDEYGGTLGIVTMEDILEELVGDIWDEHDEVEEDFKVIGENTFSVDCSVNLDEFCEFFDIKSDSDSVSLGGWIMEQLGKIPDTGDDFEYENLHIMVTETDGNRVVTATVFRTEPEEPEEEEEKEKKFFSKKEGDSEEKKKSSEVHNDDQ